MSSKDSNCETLYQIVYFNDEVGLRVAKCRQPWKCDCISSKDHPKCGYTANQARLKMIKYYRQRIQQLRKQDTRQFLDSQGYRDD